METNEGVVVEVERHNVRQQIEKGLKLIKKFLMERDGGYLCLAKKPYWLDVLGEHIHKILKNINVIDRIDYVVMIPESARITYQHTLYADTFECELIVLHNWIMIYSGKVNGRGFIWKRKYKERGWDENKCKLFFEFNEIEFVLLK